MVFINPTIETVVTANVAARHPALRRNGKSPHVSTVYRLFDNGRKSVSGRRVTLAWIKTAWGRGTTNEAIERYVRDLNDLDTPPPVNLKRCAAAIETLKERGLA